MDKAVVIKSAPGWIGLSNFVRPYKKKTARQSRTGFCGRLEVQVAFFVLLTWNTKFSQRMLVTTGAAPRPIGLRALEV